MDKLKRLAMPLGFLVVIFLLVGGVIWAQSNGDINVSGDYNDYRGSGEGDFGQFIASPTGLTDVKVTNDLFVDEGISLGTLDDNNLLTDGYTEKLVVVTITNTSSAGVENPEGETIWVYDATYQYQVATTANYRLIMGTSTVPFIVPSESAVGFDTNNGGDQSIFDSGDGIFVVNAGINPDQATSTLFRADYLGIDTRDASGDWNVIPVLSDEFLTCYASTTVIIPAQLDDTAMGTFQGQCQFKYFVIEG